MESRETIAAIATGAKATKQIITANSKGSNFTFITRVLLSIDLTAKAELTQSRLLKTGARRMKMTL